MSGSRLIRLTSLYFFINSCLIKGCLNEVWREPSFFSVLRPPFPSRPIFSILSLLCHSSAVDPSFLSHSFHHSLFLPLRVVFSHFDNHLIFSLALPPLSPSPSSPLSLVFISPSLNSSDLFRSCSPFPLMCCCAVAVATCDLGHCSAARLCVCVFLWMCVCAGDSGEDDVSERKN